MNNRYGLDVNYHTNFLKQLVRDMDNYTKQEYARSLLRMVAVTSPETMQEAEFTKKLK